MKLKIRTRTSKEEMLRNIFGQVIKVDKTAKHPEMFVNMENEWVITYKQGRKKYAVIIEEV